MTETEFTSVLRAIGHALRDLDHRIGATTAPGAARPSALVKAALDAIDGVLGVDLAPAPAPAPARAVIVADTPEAKAAQIGG